MSTCISRAGEYSAHETEPGNYICDRCGVLDEEGIFAELDTLRAKVAADNPASVAQDATDATETPARTPGGSEDAEARTEAQGGLTEEWKQALEAVLDPGKVWKHGVLVAARREIESLRAEVARVWRYFETDAAALRAALDAERESATDPSMTNLEAELVALRQKVDAYEAALHEEREMAHETIAALQAEVELLRAGWRKVTSALGYGDGITEPQIGFDEFIGEMERQASEASEWRESQLWRNDCHIAGHPDLEDCFECDPSLRLSTAESASEEWKARALAAEADAATLSEKLAARATVRHNLDPTQP